MRKILVIAIIIILSSASSSFAQRYIMGKTGIQATYSLIDGVNTDNFNIGLHLSTYTVDANRWIMGFDYMNRIYKYEDFKIPLNQITTEGGYYLRLFADVRRTFFFSAGVTGMLGYEIINNNKNVLPDGATIKHENKFLYGGSVGCELETYITDKIVFLLNVRERILFGSTVTKFHTQIGAGFKFIVN